MSAQNPHAPKPSNLIFYGPPGTGKSAMAIQEAVLLCDGHVPPTCTEMHQRYGELVSQGQIRSVVFHPAYSYQDFVEGVRPAATKAGIISKPVPGLFREMASVAEQALNLGSYSRPFNMEGRRVFKMTLGRAGFEDHIFDKALAENYVVLGWGGDIDWSSHHSKQTIAQTWTQQHPSNSIHDANIVQTAAFCLDMQIGDLVIVANGNHQFRAIGEVIGSYEFAPTGYQNYNHRRAVRWLFVPDEPVPTEGFYKAPFQMSSCHLLEDDLLDVHALTQLLPATMADNRDSVPQFVLICDDIDRADLTRVFGEVLSLIEPEKRIGCPKEQRVTLPYSRQLFGVPANLHIIGTMNGGEASLQKLDAATLRRFRFKEMRPNPSALPVVAGIDLAYMLNLLNSRISYILGQEHQIGHSYFSGCANKADIDDVMRYQIIPLLVRLLKSDWTKIAAILGDNKGQYMLDCTFISAPAGLEEIATGPRPQWSIRDHFRSNSYDGLQ